MEIGKLYLYKGKLVYITDGVYESGGRISNFWGFRYVNEDGTFGKMGGDYDNSDDKFSKTKLKVVGLIIK